MGFGFTLSALVLIVALFFFAAALATGVNVYLRSVALEKEIATRRVLGARRSNIVSMLLLESMTGICVGIVLGVGLISIAMPFLPSPFSAASAIGAILLVCSALAGSWIAARRASRISVSKSGLFCSAPDRRSDRTEWH